MLAFISIIIIAIVSVTNVSGDEHPFIVCQMQGDPRLQPFQLNENAATAMSFCGLRNAPVTFFRNRYVRIEVVNNGGSAGNIVSFIATLLDEAESDDDVCTFTEQYFKYSAREYTCGLAKITLTSASIQIQNTEADIFVTLFNGMGNYNINLQTSWENANRSRGMCRDGCTTAYTANTRSMLPPTIPQDRIMSTLAEQICDIYLKEYTKLNVPVPIKLIPFVATTRQGCITDIKAMGDKKYAEQALISIVSTVMTFSATSLAQIQKLTQEALAVANHLSKIADQVTSQLVAAHRANN